MSAVDAVTSFGATWLALAPITAAALAGAALLVRAGDGRGLLARFGSGAARATGLPDWVAAPAVALLGFALPMAALGFYWDVAWHIDKGRDEFLFSPPHVALLLGLAGIGVAGLLGVAYATWARPPAVWRAGRWHVPLGCAALVIAGVSSQIGYFVDELWHWAYGLDVSMWGPTHLVMVSAAAFSPLALWALLAEAGPGTAGGATVLRRALRPFTAVVSIVALSAWQLEFDLGVPQWQQLYHPVLVAGTAGIGLVLARTALGPGGALVAAAGAVGVRALAGAAVYGLGLTMPRFPLYLAAAVAVEAAALVAGRRSLSTVRSGLLTGAAAGTVGLAGAAAWTHAFGFHPWTGNLFPGVLVAGAVAVAGAVLGTAAGRVAAGRPSGARAGAVAACFAVLLLGVAAPWPRRVPDMVATVRTAPAGDGLVDVTVEVPPGTGRDVDRFEVLSWQGDGSQRAPLVEVAPGTFAADRPVPVGGTWKSMVHYVSHDRLGSIPVFMPRDEEIGASEVPVVPERTEPFGSLAMALQREARNGGPAWPAVVAYTWVVLAIGVQVAAIVAAYVGLERRRRAGRWVSSPGAGSLEGRRVVVTGAAGGIGRRLVGAMAANGARVVGIDRTPGDGLLAADLTDQAAARAAVTEAGRRLGGIDVLVNNAGVGAAGDSGAMPDGAAAATVAVNLFGTWHATAAAMPALLAAGGHVVNVSSGLAVATVPWTGAYTASKRAVLGYGDVLRAEYGDRVRVSAVLPGYVRTAIHDGAAASGASLDGVTREEPVDGAVAAVVGAVETGRRRMASSPVLALELFAARHVPVVADAVLRRRVRRALRRRPAPVFAGAPPAATVR